MITLHRLEGFFRVARAGGYARAAREFPYPITQPALHQQVKKLEAEVGTTLLERIGKDRMQPTAAGQQLLEFVTPFFERLPSVVLSLRSGTFSGPIRIDAETLLVRSLLPAWLKQVQRRHPHVEPHLRELHHTDVRTLRNGEADLLVAWLPEIPEDVASIQVATLRPFLVLPRGHLLARRRLVRLADLAADTFIAYTPGIPARDLQLRALKDAGVVPARLLAASTAEAILGFVESGLGYSLVPSLLADGPRGKGIVARALGEAGGTFPVMAAWRKDTPENPLLDAVLACAPRG